MAELLSESELDEEQTKQVRMSKAAGHHLVHIIEDLLDIARIEAELTVKREKAAHLPSPLT